MLQAFTIPTQLWEIILILSPLPTSLNFKENVVWFLDTYGAESGGYWERIRIWEIKGKGKGNKWQKPYWLTVGKVLRVQEKTRIDVAVQYKLKLSKFSLGFACVCQNSFKNYFRILPSFYIYETEEILVYRGTRIYLVSTVHAGLYRKGGLVQHGK